MKILLLCGLGVIVIGVVVFFVLIKLFKEEKPKEVDRLLELDEHEKVIS